MKKLKGLRVFTLLAIMCVAVFFISFATPFFTIQKPQTVVSNAILSYEYANLDEVIAASTHVMVGTVLSYENSGSASVQEIEILVDEVVKGEWSHPSLLQYDNVNAGKMEIGGKYLLFLEAYDAPFYPRAIFSLTDKDALYRLDDNIVTGLSIKGTTYLSDNNIGASDELLSLVKQSYGISVLNAVSPVLDTLTYDVSMTESSYIISEVSIVSVSEIDNFVVSADLQVLQTYKGKIFEDRSYLLPAESGIEVGNKYIVIFTQTRDGTAVIAARHGAVVGEFHPHWDELHTLLSAQFPQ